MEVTKPTVKYVSFEDLLQQDGYLVYTNIGCSMMPLLRERRDVIEIRKKESERCKKYVSTWWPAIIIPSWTHQLQTT